MGNIHLPNIILEIKEWCFKCLKILYNIICYTVLLSIMCREFQSNFASRLHTYKGNFKRMKIFIHSFACKRILLNDDDKFNSKSMSINICIKLCYKYIAYDRSSSKNRQRTVLFTRFFPLMSLHEKIYFDLLNCIISAFINI